MGGHSKKSGRGGGGGGGHSRTARQERAKPLKKDPGVPDLRAAASRLAHTAAKRTHSIFASNNGSGSGGGGGGGALTRGVWQRRLHDKGGVQHAAAHNDHNNDGGGGGVDVRRAEMTSLALRAAERLHEHHAPLQLLLDHVEGGGGERDSYGRVATHASDVATTAAHEGSVDEEVAVRGGAFVGGSLRRFYKAFQRVVESCDVLLQVVDARDPLGCRLTQLEQNIRSTYGDERKTIVVVLNKVDLLPSPQVAEAWVTYFEQHEHLQCVPFSATAKGASGQSYVSLLYRRLRALARGAGGAANSGGGASARKAIVVGVIGYPNVGKSSIINALKRRPVVGVGNVPGFTTGNTEVELRSDIRVLDCPGVVCPGDGEEGGGGGGGDVVLRNAVKISDVANPVAPVQRLLQRCTQVQLNEHAAAAAAAVEDDAEGDVAARRRPPMLHPLAQYYGIGAFDVHDVYDFLYHVGVRRGKLLKGGRVDEEATARMVLHDWNDGRIAYYTLPPTIAGMHEDGSLRAADYDAHTAASVRHHEDEEDDGGDVCMQPQLVSAPSRGLVVDGLPTFHLDLRGMARRRSGNAKWSTSTAPHTTGNGNDGEGEDDDDEEEL